MSAPIFRPAPGAHLSKTDAQALGEVMIILRREDRLTPRDLLAQAEPADSPIHDLYPWTFEATLPLRIGLAAYHLRSVEIVVSVKPDGEEVTSRFAYVLEGADLPYVTINDLAADRDLAREIADQLYTGALELLAVYRTYCRQFRTATRPFAPVARSIVKMRQPKRKHKRARPDASLRVAAHRSPS